MARLKAYYGWRVLAVSTMAMALGSGVSMQAFGLYVAPLEDEFGWTRAEVSLAFSASVLVSGLAGPLIGHWIDTRGARSSILIGGILTAFSYLLLAATDSLWQFYLFYSIHAACRQMMFFIPFQALISHWFQRRRGIALSILGSGFSIGGFAILPMMALAIAEFDWRGAYLFSAALIGGFFLPAGLLIIRDDPQDVGQRVDGDEPEGSESGEALAATPQDDSFPLRQAVRTPLFWTLAFGFMFFFFGLLGWLVHQVPFYESEGMSRSTAALIVALGAAASIVARLVMGVIADRIERFEVVVIVLMALMGAAMGTLLVSTAAPAIAVFLGFWVIGSSAGPIVESMVLIRAFGMRYFGSILGAVVVVETIGEIISPLTAGAIYDWTGSYDLALVMFMSAFAAGIVLFAIAARMKAQTEPRALVAAA